MPRKKNWRVGKNREVGRIENQTAVLSGAEQDHVIGGIFCLLLRQGQKLDKKLEVQVFLARLLVLLSFAGLPRFRLMLEASVLSLTIGLTIGEAETIGGEVAVGFSGWSR